MAWLGADFRMDFGAHCMACERGALAGYYLGELPYFIRTLNGESDEMIHSELGDEIVEVTNRDSGGQCASNLTARLLNACRNGGHRAIATFVNGQKLKAYVPRSLLNIADGFKDTTYHDAERALIDVQSHAPLQKLSPTFLPAVIIHGLFNLVRSSKVHREDSARSALARLDYVLIKTRQIAEKSSIILPDWFDLINALYSRPRSPNVLTTMAWLGADFQMDFGAHCMACERGALAGHLASFPIESS
ncbi:hypothetical protein EV360DRAFT_74688 [Lentinula raphanica]|nr:hypothetical protein EV360DRAFT_74688 [Lentinula raphanica]